MSRPVRLAAAALWLALAGGCRSDAPAEPWTRRDPPGPLGALVDWPLPGNFTAFDRNDIGGDGALWATRDLDGDGRPDLVVTGEAGAVFEPKGLSHWVLYRNTGRGFATGVDWPVPAVGYRGRGAGFATCDFQTRGSFGDTEVWRTVDLDGDGRPDLVITGERRDEQLAVLDAKADPHWRVHRNLGDRFAPEAERWPIDAAAANVSRGVVDVGVRPDENERRGQLLDLDGDGLLDLVATTDGEGPTFPGARRVPGLADGEPHWRFLRNTGAGFATAVAWPVPDRNRAPEPQGGLHATFADDGWYGGLAWTLADLDGDRRPDLVITSAPGLREVPGLADGPHWEVHRNTGSGFDPVAVHFPVPALASGLGPNGPFSLAAPLDTDWSLLDFDGDGRADLLQTAVPTESVDRVAGFPDAPTWVLHQNLGDGFDLAGTPVGVPDGGLDTAGFAGAACSGLEDAHTRAVHAWRTVDVDGDGRPDLLWVLARGGADAQVFGHPSSPRWLVSFQR